MEVVASLSQGRTAAAQCGLFTHKSVPVIFEPPCKCKFVPFHTVKVLGGGCRVITPWPLYPRERTHPASFVPQSRSARFGEENKSFATAGIERRIVCVRTRVTVNRNSGYSNDLFIRCHLSDLFIHCHHYDF